jgi:chloramphenicol 3-O-phosphotransferase
MKPITILTGPAAAGKNSVADIYATQFSERCAVVDVDVLQRMFQTPCHKPWDDAPGLAQHRLSVRHACMLARSFVSEGYEVLILDALWADLARSYREALADYPVRVVRLLPSWEESLRRLRARPVHISEAEARWFYERQLALREFDFGLDNTHLPPEEVAAWLASLPGTSLV